MGMLLLPIAGASAPIWPGVVMYAFGLDWGLHLLFSILGRALVVGREAFGSV